MRLADTEAFIGLMTDIYWMGERDYPLKILKNLLRSQDSEVSCIHAGGTSRVRREGGGFQVQDPQGPAQPSDHAVEQAFILPGIFLDPKGTSKLFNVHAALQLTLIVPR